MRRVVWLNDFIHKSTDRVRAFQWHHLGISSFCQISKQHIKLNLNFRAKEAVYLYMSVIISFLDGRDCDNIIWAIWPQQILFNLLALALKPCHYLKVAVFGTVCLKTLLCLLQSKMRWVKKGWGQTVSPWGDLLSFGRFNLDSLSITMCFWVSFPLFFLMAVELVWGHSTDIKTTFPLTP